MMNHLTPIPKLQKTLRRCALIAVAGALLSPVPLALAQQSLRTDTGGHPTASLNLGDTHITGTLDAARLPHDAAFRTLSITDRTVFAGPVSLPANQPITLADGDISGSILTIGAGGVFTPQTLAPGRSIRRNAANTAFEDYAPNTGDGSALTNLNGSNVATGTVAPARLGTGTPTSTTILRGDGTWGALASGMTTIATTANLLMGDGLGNAVAVGSSADLSRLLQLRADTRAALTAVPDNLLLPTGLVLRNGTLNANGTLTIPAHDYVQWNTGDTVALPHFAYAVATSEVAVGSSGFFVFAGVGGYNYTTGTTDIPLTGMAASTPLPGVSKLAFTNQDSYGLGRTDYVIYVVNKTAVPVTIYPPVVTLTDAGVLPVQSMAETTIVPPPVVRDLDFSRFSSADRTGRYLAERQIPFAADGVNGSSANSGTLYAPRPTTAGFTLATGSTLGIYRNSVLRESLPLLAAGTARGIVVQDVALGSVRPLPILSALDPVASGAFTSNGDGTYSCLWTPGETLVNNGYSNVYAVEINTATELLTPIASRRRLVDVSAAGGAAGTVWIQAPGTGAGQSGSTQWKAIIHPSDNLAPGGGTYRYEVVSRNAPAAWNGAAPDGALSGLQLVGSNGGYGCVTSPLSFVGDRLVFVHATTHNAVLQGGSLQRSVFYESGDTVAPGPSIQLAWYTGMGTGQRWDTRECLFYMNVGDRYANGIISHTGGGTSFERGDIADCAFLGARWSNGALHGIAMDYVDVTTGTIERVYVQGVYDAFGLSMPLSTEVRNSVFRQVNQARVGVNFHDNLVLAESAGDVANAAGYPTACYFQQSGASATNNLLWAHGLSSSGPYDNQACGINFYGGNSPTNCTFQRNILVLNPASTTAAAAYLIFNTASKTGQHIDYNLVINLAKGGFQATSPTGTPSNGFQSWQSYVAGQTFYDQHSLYVDLSGDPRGLQAVFADPASGDFRWAQTDTARRCAAYCKANNIGPAAVTSRWPTVPTVDEAVRLLCGL